MLNRVGATPFLLAAKAVDLPLMRALLAEGADPARPNVDGTTPLMVAAGVGIWAPGESPGTEEEAVTAVKMLLDLGAGKVGGEALTDLVIGAFDLDGGNLWSVSYPSDEYATGAMAIALTPSHDIFSSGLFERTLDLGFTKLEIGVEKQNPFLLFFEHR